MSRCGARTAGTPLLRSALSDALTAESARRVDASVESDLDVRRARTEPRVLLDNDVEFGFSEMSVEIDSATATLSAPTMTTTMTGMESVKAMTPPELVSSFLLHAGACRCDFTSKEEHITAIAALGVLHERELKELADIQSRVTAQEVVARVRELNFVRMTLVENIVKNGAMNSFSCVTSALAVRYLDYVLLASGYRVQHDCFWIYQLLANACMLISAKFEEPAENLKRNLCYRLQTASDISFDTTTLKKMEAIVLRELGWNASRVTPFCFIPYFLVLLNCEGLNGAAKGSIPCWLQEQLLQDAEVLTLMVLYDPFTTSSYESSVVAKAIVCILLSKFCDDVQAIDVVEPVVTNIWKKLHANANADEFAHIIQRVKHCVNLIESLKEHLSKYGNNAR